MLTKTEPQTSKQTTKETAKFQPTFKNMLTKTLEVDIAGDKITIIVSAYLQKYAH